VGKGTESEEIGERGKPRAKPNEQKSRRQPNAVQGTGRPWIKDKVRRGQRRRKGTQKDLKERQAAGLKMVKKSGYSTYNVNAKGKTTKKEGEITHDLIAMYVHRYETKRQNKLEKAKSKEGKNIRQFYPSHTKSKTLARRMTGERPK